jgi:hypothetical protein
LTPSEVEALIEPAKADERARGGAIMAPVERAAAVGGPRQERGRPEMTFDEEKQGWAFASARGLETRIAACENVAETEAQREELASMRRRLADLRVK